MRSRRMMVSTVVVLGMVLGTGAPAWADPPRPPAPSAPAAQLPAGWEITVSGGRPVLTWHADEPVPMGDAAVEFFAGDRRLGTPRPAADQRTFRLHLGDVAPAELGDLQVRAAGRRLDAPGTARRAAPAPAAPAPARRETANPVDPGVPGPYATTTGEYTLAPVQLPDFPAKVEMTAVVVAPKGTSGRRPLALFLHGRHSTCFAGADEDKVSGEWPCPAGTQPIPSHRGYLQAQRLLASQGYVTVSISANGINGQDADVDDAGAQARSSLVRLHLAKWADWSGARRATAPAIVRSAPAADLSRVLLMGHSRGGEGVNRAATDSLSPAPAAADGYDGPVRWTIRGTVLIGPTIFGHNPAPDVPSVTILPGCDGDVSDLQGQMYADATRRVSRGTALHSALYVIGANHNFFNTEWTPGQAAAPAWDDFYVDEETQDRVCSPGTATRLTAAQQQDVGATYIATAARLFVAGDDRARPLLDGSGVRAPSADPARVLTHAVGGRRDPLVVPDPALRVGGDARLCEAATDDPALACTEGESFWSVSPHFAPFYFGFPESGRNAVAMTWSAANRPVTLRPARAASVAGSQSLALRVIVPPNTTGTRFGVAVTDTRGHRAALGDVTVDGLPGTDRTTAHWGQEVRVPLAAASRARVDLRRIAALELVPRTGAGQAWLVDAWGWSPGTPAPRPAALPRVDIGQVTVDEGDSGTATYRVPVTVSGRGNGQVKLFLNAPGESLPTQRTVTIRPGTRTIDVPVTVTGNTRYGLDTRWSLSAKAVRGTVIGDYEGGVRVDDDDPMPTITVSPVAEKVTEGGTLTWRLTLSAPADDWIHTFFEVEPPVAGPELSSTDVDPTWFTDYTGEDPLPARALSAAGLFLYLDVEPGTTSGELSIPTVDDGVTEPAEQVRMRALVSPADWEDEPVELGILTGTVTDRP